MAIPLHAHAHLEGKWKCGDIICCGGKKDNPPLRFNTKTQQMEVFDGSRINQKTEGELYSYDNLWGVFKQRILSDYSVDVRFFADHLNQQDPKVIRFRKVVSNLEKKPDKFKTEQCLFVEGVVKSEMCRLAKTRPQTRTVGVQALLANSSTEPFDDALEPPSDSPDKRICFEEFPTERLARKSIVSHSISNVDQVSDSLEDAVVVSEKKTVRSRKKSGFCSALSVPIRVLGKDGGFSFFSEERVCDSIVSKFPDLRIEDVEIMGHDILQEVYLQTYTFGGVRQQLTANQLDDMVKKTVAKFIH